MFKCLVLLFKLSIIVISCTLLSVYKTSEYIHYLTKIDTFSMAALHPRNINLTGLSTPYLK